MVVRDNLETALEHFCLFIVKLSFDWFNKNKCEFKQVFLHLLLRVHFVN